MAPKLHAAGVIRCVNGVWEILDDAGHTPYNLTGISANTTRVLVTYPEITKIVTAFAETDETYVKYKITSGASVGLSQMAIQMGKTNSPSDGLINPLTAGYSSSNIWLGVWCTDSCTTCL